MKIKILMTKIILHKFKLMSIVGGIILLLVVMIYFYQERVLVDDDEELASWLTICMTDKQAQTKSFFNPGDLMLMFTEETTIEIAQKSLLAYGLLSEDEFLSDWPWPEVAPGLLLVKVPIGEEFKWLCLLEKEEIIMSVQLNQAMRALMTRE